MRTYIRHSAIVLLFVSLAVAAGMLLPPVPVRATEVTGTSVQLLSAATASGATGTVTSAFMPRCRESAIYIQWGAGTSSGGVTIESAHSESYTGTWAPLVTKAWAAASSEDIVQITGIHGAIRTRISTVIGGGGTINTWLVCN